MSEELTAEYVRERLNYDPDTGLFTWRKTRDPRYIGTKAGLKVKSGYVQIRLGKVNQYAHRLAWLYVHGKPPSAHIDHINRDKADNRISNLREASPEVNVLNRGLTVRNKSGFKGVSWNTQRGKWQVVTAVNGKKVYLGGYDTAQAASEAYEAFAKEQHGDFYYRNSGVQEPTDRYFAYKDRVGRPNKAIDEPMSHNKTGFRGVYKHGNGWMSCYKINKKKIYLGTFKTQEEAFAAYIASRKAQS